MTRSSRYALALLGVLALEACSGPGAPPSNSTQSSAGAPDATQPGATSSASGTAPWDPDAWEPKVKVQLPTLSDEELVRARDEFLSWRVPKGTTAPKVDLVRWTKGTADYAETRARCLTEAGFKAVATPDGGTEYVDGVPAEQEDALTLAAYVCDAKYTPDPRLVTDWNEDQLAVVYDYWMEYFIPCMAAHGHPISTDGAPSREVYISTFFDGKTKRWWPNETLQSLTGDDASKIRSACPGLPPDKALYGG